MKTITIHKAKTQLSKLIEQACRGEEIVIARGSHAGRAAGGNYERQR